MTRTQRIGLWVAGSVVGLLAVLFVVAIIVAQSDWFHNYVREKIVSVTEDSTGGKVDLAGFDFDWTYLRATLTDFVIHGTEPAGAPPLLYAKTVVVELKLLASLKQYIDIRALTVETPKANVIVYPDGTTNVPAPKVKKPSDKSGLETVVDLAIGKFDLHNGYLAFADQKIPINAQGENLRAQLAYNIATQGYQGTLNINPLLFAYSDKPTVNIVVNIPVVLQRDSIHVRDAKIYTPESQLVVNASMTDMKSPKTTARVNGRLALAEFRRATGIKISPQAGQRLPGVVNADLNVSMDQNRIDLSSARLTLGGSNVEASGTLKDPAGKGAVQFRATLNATELGRIFELAQQPEGIVQANGNAKLVGSDYQVGGNLQARGLSFLQDGTRYRNIALNSAFYADPHRIALNGLTLDAFGGQFAGTAELLENRNLKLTGDLRHFDIATLARSVTGKQLAYGGVASGPVELTGDLKKPGVTGFNARTNVSIAATKSGTPLSGRLNVNYSGASNNIEMANSYLNLGGSRLQLSGSLGRTITFNLTTHNLNDFLPLLRMTSPDAKLPVELARRGSASFNGTISGSLSAPRIAGHLEFAKFTVEDREFDRLATDLNAAPAGAALQSGILMRGTMQTNFAASVGLKNWKPEPNEPLRVNAGIRNGDLADVLALAGQTSVQTSGALNASAQVAGTVGNPQGRATLNVSNGSIEGEPFDRIQVQVNLSDQLVTIPSASMVAGPARIDLNASFRHPRDSFSTGTLQAHVASNQVQLAQFRTLLKPRPGLSGVAQVNGDVAATLAQVKGKTECRITAVNGDASVRGLRADNENYGDLTAAARTTGNAVNYRVNSDFAGSTVNVNGATRLEPEYPTNATAQIANLPVERVLALANRPDIHVSGNLSGNASFSGTLATPTGSADVTLVKAVVEDEPIDRAHVRVDYAPDDINAPVLEVVAGPSRISGSAKYGHKPGDFEDGQLTFRVNDSTIHLANLHTIQRYRPGLAGTVQLAADGAATVRKTKTGPEVLTSAVNADVTANSLQMNGTNFGDLRLNAATHGDRVDYKLDSDVAKSSIHGTGETVLRADYPTRAQLAFNGIRYSNIRPFLPTASNPPSDWDAIAEGQVTIDGPLRNMDALTGEARLNRLEFTSVARPGSTGPVTLKNQGLIVFALSKSVVNVRQARMTGPSTDIALSGTAALTGDRAMNVALKGNTNLSVLQQMSGNIYSSGEIVIDATVRGTLTDPSLTGRILLQNASMNYIDLPNGISNANGTIILSGTTATIQNLTAESGGGRITMTGTVSYTEGSLRYSNLGATARGVRVRYPQGASIVANARVSLNGTADRSVLSGTVTLEQIGFSPNNDFGSMLSRGSTPAQVPSAPVGPLAGMRLDVRIRTSPTASFSTPLAQNLEADVDLTLRGTAANPGMTGRINITSGDLVFFGNKYTVNQGTISFYDPFRIYPVLNVDLETIAKGVQVDLTVSGPVDNMKLTYHSDPPLQFSEVVALLATGRTPTSDPTIVANQPATPPQTFQQMGESALLGQAIANPVASRLQRVFGVSQLKIDPTFTSGSELPQARMTLQQQVAPNITFTYITNLSQSNDQIIRVEWAFNPQWSAIATREENGRVGVDFFYKKKLR